MNYTTKQVAAELGISAVRVRQLAYSREVGVKHGRDFLFTARDIDAMRIRPTGRPKARPTPKAKGVRP